MATYSSGAGRSSVPGAGFFHRRRAALRLAGAAVALVLYGCRPGAALTPRRLTPTATAPLAVSWLGSPGIHNTPGVPLVQSLELQKYLVEILENHTLKRISRWGLALEPGETAEEITPREHSLRLNKDLEPIESHFNAGEEMFETELSGLHGFGDAMGGSKPNFHRVHRGSHGGPDSTSCRSCHHRGGDDGAGEFNEAGLLGGDGNSERNANERNPPALGGGGAIQILAREITAALHKQLTSVPPNHEYEVQLTYQGVDFGTVRAHADGSLDASALRAIDPDVVVRPFGWKGTHATLRRFAEEAFQVHHGMQSPALVERRAHSGTDPRDTSPATRELLNLMGDGPDPDGDTIAGELMGANLTAISVYLTLLPMPVIMPPRAPDLVAAFRDGGTVFSELGCASCHKPSWHINDPVWIERGEDETSRVRLELDLRKHIRNGPQLSNFDTMQGGYPIFIFSDLRRHDMGPGLADKYVGTGGMGGLGKSSAPPGDTSRQPAIPAAYFLTRPLWGLAESAPYMHDGRSLTVHDAVLAHGGEADKARTAYLALPVTRQRALQVFLLALTRPPLPEVIQ